MYIYGNYRKYIMNTDRFFRRIDTSYRFMKARESFFHILLTAGTVAIVVCAAAAVFPRSFLYWTVAFCMLICIGIAFVFAIRAFCGTAPYEASLYYDRAVNGGERFPTLREIAAENRQGWVRETLEHECAELAERKPGSIFPFIRGRGKYFFLPYIAVSVILALPTASADNGERGSRTPGKNIFSAPDTASSIIKGGTQDKGRTRVSPRKNLTPRQMATIQDLMKDPNFLELLKKYLDPKGTGPANGTVAAIKENILKGNTKTAEQFLSLIEDITGGSGTGAGAGNIDRIRKALDTNDLARAAAEFEQFLAYLSTRKARTIVLEMKGKVEEYKKAVFAKKHNGDTPSYPDVIGISQFPRVDTARIPFRYRETVKRYFSYAN
jgi:hypothetical protein